ncbi:MAG: hypothetical protein CM15mP73_0510 [Hyphomicrobiales bacterium]|nr:MAG: hypothetical protein CM15mP73_0510 [Hyphomicrobiales bacterium]
MKSLSVVFMQKISIFINWQIDAIQGKIDQIEVSFRYQTNITNKWFKLKGSLLNNSHGNPYISGLLFDITRDRSQEINTQRLQKHLVKL